RLPALGPDGPLSILRCAHERPGAQRLPVGRRLDLVPHPSTAQPAPANQLAAHAAPGLPVATIPAHLPSVPARAPRRRYPRQEPDAVVPHVRICAGGAGRPASLPRKDWGGDSRGLEGTPGEGLGNKLRGGSSP